MAMGFDRVAGRLMLISSLLFTGAAGTVLTAHAFEIFGGYLPCHLCLIERYAYYFAVPRQHRRVLRRARGEGRCRSHHLRPGRARLPRQRRARLLSFRRRVEMVAGADGMFGRFDHSMGRGRSRGIARDQQSGGLRRGGVALAWAVLRRMECGAVAAARRTRRLRRGAEALRASPYGSSSVSQ